MFCLQMKVELFFLQKLFITVSTFMRVHTCVFFQMIVHRILIFIFYITILTYIEAVGLPFISQIRHFNVEIPADSQCGKSFQFFFMGI